MTGKIKKFAILLVIFLITSCAMEQPKNKSLEKISSNSNETNDFHQYISLFEDIEIPIILDESYLTYKFLIQKKTIETDFVNIFIEENRKLTPEGYLPEEEDLFDYYTYYPIGKFQTSSTIIGIIYAKSGVAGGQEDRFFLNLYSTKGEKMDKLLVGKCLADCGFMSQITSVISQSEISLVKTEFKGDCDEDTYQEVSREEKRYRIDIVHGKIEILKE